MNKTIGIITIQKSQNNYGGSLQCFALYEYLHSLGYSCEVIDLDLPGRANYVDSIRFRIMRTHYSFSTVVKGWIKELFGIRRLRNPNFSPDWNPVAGERFKAFNTQIHYSKQYSFIPDLYHNPPEYDIYISGSDQLWNPEQPYCVEPYFLTFVKNKKALKISYGTSIGVSKLSDDEKRKFRKWLKSYDCISVREQEARDLLASFVPKDIFRVPDPTFLLEPEKWQQLAVKPEFTKPYILVFTLYQEKTIIDKAVSLAKEKGLKVFVIDQNYNGLEDDTIQAVREAGPREFIGWIQQAYLVLTDSFHCTVFSLIMKSHNFYTYIAPNATRGSRIRNLLKQYCLSNHVVTDMNIVSSDVFSACLDVNSIRKKMEAERYLGREYLQKAIDIEK